MNTKSIAIQKYVAFSIALMMALVVALVGWRILGVWAAAAAPEYPDPAETVIPPTSLPTIAPTAVVDDPVDVEPQPNMTYIEALLLAMKKEKAAYRLYVDLAAAGLDEELTAMFLALAAEEAKHKLRFELEYDGQVIE